MWFHRLKRMVYLFLVKYKTVENHNKRDHSQLGRGVVVIWVAGTNVVAGCAEGSAWAGTILHDPGLSVKSSIAMSPW